MRVIKVFDVEHDIVRADGRLEKSCEHGVGHPVGHLTEWKPWMWTHGCDGCCSKWPLVKEEKVA